MTRDLGGQPTVSEQHADLRRSALELSAMVQRAIDAGAPVQRIEAVDIAGRAPHVSKLVRTGNGTGGGNSKHRRQLRGHMAAAKRKSNKEKYETAPSREVSMQRANADTLTNRFGQSDRPDLSTEAAD